MLSLNNLVTEISKRLINRSLERATKYYKRYVIERRAVRLKNSLVNLLSTIGDTIGSHFIGKPSYGEPFKPIEIPGNQYFPGSLTWVGLSKEWIQRKGHNKFFIYTGNLVNKVSRTNYPSKLGISVKINEKRLENLLEQKEPLIAAVEVSVFHRVPKLYQKIISKLDFRNPEISEWLFGPKEGSKLGYGVMKGRPLVNPVLYYYMNVHVPKLIKRVFKD